MNPIVDALHGWQNFYFMLGGASGGLLGLMFVAISLAMQFVEKTSRNEFRAFVTPSVIYLVSGLLIACVMLVPAYAAPVLALILAGFGFVGLIIIAESVRGLIRAARAQADFDRWEWLTQIFMPPIGYGVYIAAAACLLFDQYGWAFALIWVGSTTLLIAGVANTWSLILWIVNHRIE